jgi:CYTH domain-containing protein
VLITQAYLNTPEEGNFRIRKRGEGDLAVYIKTVKIKISDIKRIEIENYISKEEYLNYISQKENISGIISKDRYCIAYNSTYYELDVYPFWQDKATIEIEMLSEDESFSFPPFVKLIREVSAESEYRNFALAQKYRNLF